MGPAGDLPVAPQAKKGALHFYFTNFKNRCQASISPIIEMSERTAWHDSDIGSRVWFFGYFLDVLVLAIVLDAFTMVATSLPFSIL